MCDLDLKVMGKGGGGTVRNYVLISTNMPDMN